MLISRRARLCALLATAAALALPAVSQGDATLTCHGTDVILCKFDSGLQPTGAHPMDIPCLTSEEGTADGTGREVQYVNFSSDPDAHWVHFTGRYVETGRIDFPSGMYVLYRLDARGGAQIGDTRTALTFTDVGKITGTVYGADGEPTGQVVSNHATLHFTWIDSGDAGFPFDSDPTDTFLADVEYDRWVCS
jgi:hypothetical protein